MTAANTAPALELNNGVTMHALGLGMFQSPPKETSAAVEAALEAGYRHIDTAAAYGNEREVGDAVRADTHGKSPARVMLRSAAQMTAIDGLESGKRGGPEPEDMTLETFGLAIPEA